MAKKKTKKKIKLECCGEESCEENNPNEKIKVYVCPNCRAVDVGYKFTLKNLFGLIPRMRCKVCGYEATTFPIWIIDKDKLTHKHIKPKKEKQLKEKKTSYKKKIIEKYCPNCKDVVKVRMKNRSVDSFICENCKFEIREK